MAAFAGDLKKIAKISFIRGRKIFGLLSLCLN